MRSCSAHTTRDTLGRRLSEDNWLVQNTLPFILPYLDIPDVLRCAQVCKLWQEAVNESTIWRSVTLSRYSLNLDRMVSFLQDVGTKHLRITECEIANYNCSKNPPPAKFMKQTEALFDPKEWEALRVSVQVSPGCSDLDVYIWESASSLFKELRPHKLTCLSKLGTLKSLVLTKIFTLQRDHYRKKPTFAPTSETGESSTLRSFIEYHMEKSHPLNYLSFLICECPKFSLMKTIGDLRFLPNLHGLHLLDIHIAEGFEHSLKLCTNLKVLRVSPLFRKWYVARDNGRIFEGVKRLNLRNFIWIFSKDYAAQCYKLLTEEMSDYAHPHLRPDFLIPFIGDPDFLHDDLLGPEHWLPSFTLVEWSDLQNELQALMVQGTFIQFAHASMDSLGEHLSKNEWLVYNTLPFILPFLTVPDVLHCVQVCKLWLRIINDSTYWCAVILRNYKLKLDKMTQFLQGFKTDHLKLVDCEYVGDCTTSGFETLTHLKKLELSDCTSKSVETIADGNPNIEVLKVSLIVCPSALKLDLSFVSKMPRLKQLTIYCYREVQHLKEMFATLGNLERLWLLGVTHIDFEDLPSSMNLDSYPQLQSLGLGHCTELPSSIVDFVKSFPNLRELCFEYCGCPKWDPADIFSGLTELLNLRRLHLIEFNIKEGFEKGLKLCTNLEELTISPGCSRFLMGRFNGRIFEGVKNLKLKRFTWGFSSTYMTNCRRIFEVESRVPFVGDADYLHGRLGGDESELKSWKLITLGDLQQELQELMGACRVRVVGNYNPQDFFWSPFNNL
ncbi:uncharacterized protein [Euwallacea similis]|uniref:uncharacterized protein n=1 Tax=Euwallacea similis TaxID=1736056 RepID=UPI00344FF0F5